MAGLSESPAAAILRADNLERAKSFYIDVLGLREATELVSKGMIYFEAGQGTMVSLYERPGMGAPENTVLGFGVAAEDFDGVMTELRDKGVVFEDYDMPEIELKTVNGIATMDGAKAAWFKDSEGNIVNLVTM